MLKFIPQHDQMDCAPACLSMMASHYGKEQDLQFLRESCYLSREGVSMLGITEAAQQIGFSSLSAQLTTERLIELSKTGQVPLPCILHWNQVHFVVLRGINKNIITGKYTFKLADPGHGFISLSQEKFEMSWLSENKEGVALFVEPTEQFYKQEKPKQKDLSVKYLFQYLTPFRKRLGQTHEILFSIAKTSFLPHSKKTKQPQ